MILPGVPPSVEPRGGAALAVEATRRLQHPAPAHAEALLHLRCPACDWQHTLRRSGRSRHSGAHLERLLPRVPVRHWVFSLGDAAQARLAAHARLRTRVARACVDAVFAWLRRAAARRSVPGPHACGAVSAIHRVGAALDANVHVHALVLDGVYSTAPDSAPPVFHPLPPPRHRDLRRTLAELRTTLDALLARAPTPAASSATPARSRARVVHRVAIGPVVRPTIDASTTTTATAALVQRNGELDVRAGPPIDGRDHSVRARLCRYITRPPFDPAAIEPGPEGRVRYRLAHPFSDGTTHVELTPQALAARLHGLATGAHRPPVAYHGVLAPKVATRFTGKPHATTQLPLLSLPREPDPEPRRGHLGDPEPPRPRDLHDPATSRTAPPALGLRCPRCDTPVQIVAVEPLEPRAA